MTVEWTKPIGDRYIGVGAATSVADGSSEGRFRRGGTYGPWFTWSLNRLDPGALLNINLHLEHRDVAENSDPLVQQIETPNPSKLLLYLWGLVKVMCVQLSRSTIAFLS